MCIIKRELYIVKALDCVPIIFIKVTRLRTRFGPCRIENEEGFMFSLLFTLLTNGGGQTTVIKRGFCPLCAKMWQFLLNVILITWFQAHYPVRAVW